MYYYVNKDVFDINREMLCSPKSSYAHSGALRGCTSSFGNEECWSVRNGRPSTFLLDVEHPDKYILTAASYFDHHQCLRQLFIDWDANFYHDCIHTKPSRRAFAHVARLGLHID